MKIITIDFETFWSQDYSLSRMTPLAYVTDPRFEVISTAVKVDGGRPSVYFGADDTRAALAALDLSQCAVLGHNMSAFDCYVLSTHFGVRPAVWLCTLAMARPIHERTTGCSLGRLVEAYDLGRKDGRILDSTRGKRLADFTPAERGAMRVYNAADADQCYALFRELRGHYTAPELWHIDALVRMRTEPQFVLDVEPLRRALEDERARKQHTLIELAGQLGVGAGLSPDDIAEAVRGELASQPKFAALLTARGVAVPLKPSKTDPTKRIAALAKNDEDFIALQDHDDEIVAAAVRARLDVKSTQLESRIERFIDTAQRCGGRMPVPLRYCGAVTTGRDSGDDGLNMQNLPRVSPQAPRPSDCLRMSLLAPEGHVVGVSDQSQIELRMNHTLWKVDESMELYARDPRADLYSAYGARRYATTVEAIKANKPRRLACKLAQLQLQYGSGAATFMHVARVQGKLDMSLVAAEEEVRSWRAIYERIVGGWRRCEEALKFITRGREWDVDPWGHIKTCAEGLRLPSGRLIRYPDLRWLDADGVVKEMFDGAAPDDEAKVLERVGWWYGHGRHRRRIYGAKVVENAVQAIARDSVFECAVRFYRLTGLRHVLRVHDELVYIFPEKRAGALLAQLQATMRTPPSWWPELVVWSDGDIAASYGAAK